MGPGEFGAEKNDLRRIVNPDEYDDERSRCAVGGFQALFADVKADQKLADLEKRCGEHAPRQNLLPFDLNIGEPFEHHREHERCYCERHDEGRYLKQ